MRRGEVQWGLGRNDGVAQAWLIDIFSKGSRVEVRFEIGQLEDFR